MAPKDCFLVVLMKEVIEWPVDAVEGGEDVSDPDPGVPCWAMCPLLCLP